MWTAHRVSVLVSPPRCVGALRCAARLSRPGTRVSARTWVVRAATSPGHPWCGSGVAGRWCRRPAPPRSTTGTAATRARTAATSRTRRHAAWVGPGSRSRRTALDDTQVSAVAGRQSAGGALAEASRNVRVGLFGRGRPRLGRAAPRTLLRRRKGVRGFNQTRSTLLRFCFGTASDLPRHDPALASRGGFALPVGEHLGPRRLVVEVVVDLPAVVRLVPQPPAHQLGHVPVRARDSADQLQLVPGDAPVGEFARTPEDGLSV